jgi:NADPH:quinone reductase-like Zn-dependent oxidoreductase
MVSEFAENQDLTQMFTLLADGALTPHIAAPMPLSDAAAALQLAESRTVVGKIVLVPDPTGA